MIDATDLVVSPGFIDAHVHADLALLANPHMEGLVTQGVTSVILGQDGLGYAPGSSSTTSFMATYAAGINGPAWPGVGWTTVRGYLRALDSGTVHNAAFLVPHGCVRMEIMGLSDRIATDNELLKMSDMVDHGIGDGAIGVSTGLHYIPAAHADGRELIALGLGARGTVYVTHMRDYESGRDEALQESIEVGRLARCRVHISHLNMRPTEGLPAIEQARSMGIDVTYDTYPYLYGMTLLTRILPISLSSIPPAELVRELRDPTTRASLSTFLESPERAWATKRLGSIVATEYQDLEGLTIDEAARVRGSSVTDIVCDVLVACNLEVAVIGSRHHRQNEVDVEGLMRHEAHVFGSDGIFAGAMTHPRGYGTFARILGEYVRDRGVLELETAIEHMTSRTAAIFGLTRRGRLAVGYHADVVIFDPATIKATATFDKPQGRAEGVEHVFVNGVPVIRGRALTGALPGRAIRGAASGRAA